MERDWVMICREGEAGREIEIAIERRREVFGCSTCDVELESLISSLT